MKYWTKEEDNVLMNQVTRNADNLKKAFQETARLIDRTPAGCAQRWYTKVSKQDTICFATVSQKGVSHNRKNTTKQRNKPYSWWKKILNFLTK